MILCIDSGNTRVKWAVHDGARWLEHGAVTHGNLAALSHWQRGCRWQPTRVVLANVAGDRAAAAIGAALGDWSRCLTVARSTARACGVVNGYAQPERLGVDRWCALVGARAMHAGSCLVVGAGTATTIDTLGADGCFRGGLILPGLDLMRSALAGNTAGLPLAAGHWEPWPRTTDNAIVSGCLEAQAGAVERAYARIADESGALCLLFGGAAERLDARLDIPRRRIDPLVLEGLLRLAGEADTS